MNITLNSFSASLKSERNLLIRVGASVCFALIFSSCGPRTSESVDTKTTKTTTTVTTTIPSQTLPTETMLPETTITQANLDRVHNDMSQAEVESIFGLPTTSQSQPIPIVGGTQTTYTYQSGTDAATIIFKNNPVTEKRGSFKP